MILLELLDEKDANGRALWKVRNHYTVRMCPECSITVPAGYVSNLATVPRGMYRLCAPSDIAGEAVVHDWMCGEFVEGVGSVRPPHSYSRWLADAFLYEMMRENTNIPAWRRWGVYLAVRAYARYAGLR